MGKMCKCTKAYFEKLQLLVNNHFFFNWPLYIPTYGNSVSNTTTRNASRGILGDKDSRITKTSIISGSQVKSVLDVTATLALPNEASASKKSCLINV